jgi:hypothetical protein
MANGRKFHDAWTLSPDKKHYTNEIVSAAEDQVVAAPRAVKVVRAETHGAALAR